MSRILLAICALTVLAAGCETDAPHTEHMPIINGEECDRRTMPTAVAVITDAVITSPFGTAPIVAVTCTGTLIAPDTVLTAAHCLDPTLLTFGFGEVDELRYWVSFQPDLAYMSDQSGQGGTPAMPDDAVRALDWVAHPDFDINELQSTVNGPGEFSDIGLIFLDEPVTNVDPVLVIGRDEEDQLSEGTEVEIAGWGQQTVTAGPFDPPPPGSVGIKICGDSFINELGEHEMQIGGDQSTTRKCHGDSGGPTYLHVAGEHSESLRVIGVTSHAYDQEDCNKGGVDTRVDAYRSWLNQRMTERCEDDTRVWCETEGLLPTDWFDDEGEDDEELAGGSGCKRRNQGSVGADSNALAGGLFLSALTALGSRKRRMF